MYLTVVDKVIEANLNKGGTFILTDRIQFDNSISLTSIGLTLNLNQRYTVFFLLVYPRSVLFNFFLLWYSSMLELPFLKIIRDRKTNRNKG